MGAQVIGDKKKRQAESATGLTILRLLRRSNYSWSAVVSVPGGHDHVVIDPKTWEYEPDEGCFSSCREGLYGPKVATILFSHRRRSNGSQDSLRQ